MRAKGEGTLYQRSADGLWVVAVELPRVGDRRRRRVWARARRADAVALLAEWQRAQPAFPKSLASRALNMERARSVGARTAAETHAKRRAQPSVCPYCGTALNVFNEVEDHIVPVARGGSDAIENVHWVCWECNLAKGTRLDYRYRGKQPRPFRPAPKMRAEWARGKRRIA